MTQKYKLDPLKLTPEQRKELNDYENTKKQLDTLGDLADITQELFNVTDDTSKERKLQINQIGSLLRGVREELVKLNGKEEAEMPDFAKPIVAALDKLEKKFNVTPEVKVNVPDVNVPALDMGQFNKTLKTELPKAFEKAIKLIPQIPAVQLTPLEGAIRSLEEMMSEKLESIDIGTRLKPQFPTSLKVTNPDGTTINNPVILLTKIDTATTVGVTYIGKAAPGSSAASAVWQIKKLDTNTLALDKTWADSGAFTQIWDNRATTVVYS